MTNKNKKNKKIKNNSCFLFFYLKVLIRNAHIICYSKCTYYIS